MRKVCLWTLAIVLGLLGNAGSEIENQEDPFHVTSYARNFLIVSHDAATASWAAGEAEKVRAHIYETFGSKKQWKEPLILEVAFAPETKAALVFTDQADGRAKLRGAILQRLFPNAPFWLQRGLARFFSEKADFYPDQVRDMKLAGQWLELETLLAREAPYPKQRWQDIFERLSASLVAFLLEQHPKVLFAFRSTKGDEDALLALGREWEQWVEESRVLISTVTHGEIDEAGLYKSLSRVLNIRLKEEGSGQILVARSATELYQLPVCCREDLARRKLMENYDQLVKLDRLDILGASSSAGYLACANLVLRGKDFYGMFEELEQQRLHSKR